MTERERNLLIRLARICAEGRGQKGQEIVDEAVMIEILARSYDDDD